jgi:indolepyruvate ferredoxin oxidoreductase beta subunit
MKTYNIFISGVGGQGIGLLSEILIRAADHAGYTVKAVDTHGLAQRGGIVISQLRIGQTVYTPLIPEQEADLVVCMERNEALRALKLMARENGSLVYYDTVWQPLDVRLGEAIEIDNKVIKERCKKRNIRLIRVFIPDLGDIRMQNVAVLATMDKGGLIEGVNTQHYHQAMDDLMSGGMLENNLSLFDRVRAETTTSN